MRRGGGQLWAIDARRNPNEFPELSESTFARVICSARRAGIDDAMFREIRFTHPAPSYRAEYARIFRIPVAFDCEENSVRLEETVLGSLKPAPQSRYVQELMRNQADALLVELERARSIRFRVENVAMPLLQNGVGVEAVSAKLGLSRQTLYRRLREEGLTFEQVVDQLRHRLALHFLMVDNASVQDVAHRLGYSDASAFSRAFKRWTGRSPGRNGRKNR